MEDTATILGKPTRKNHIVTDPGITLLSEFSSKDLRIRKNCFYSVVNPPFPISGLLSIFPLTPVYTGDL